jgi:glyoxylase-like metal-dependent hydrolase (beta-lactamase superfamily II)
MPDLNPHPTAVDVELAGGETIEFGETRFRVIATPGHTQGSVCFLLERPGLRVLFAGDVIQHLNPSTPNSLGTYTAYLPPLYRGNVRAWMESLTKLRQLPLPDLVLPGHPRMDAVPQSPHLSADHWNALLKQGIEEMARLNSRYETDGASFLDGLPKELRPGLHYLGAFGHWSVYALDTPKGLFLFDAPGGPGLVDFLSKRFERLGWQDRKLTAVLPTSADEEAIAGLPALVEHTGCAVVASRAGMEDFRRRCPAGTRVLTEEELEQSGWFDVKAIPLQGHGKAPVAYEVQWAGRTILVSGRIPVKLDWPTGQQLLSDLTGPNGKVDDYWKSLRRLADVKPNLWLPAVPLHGQNANLYDDDWEKVLAQNRQLISNFQLKR